MPTFIDESGDAGPRAKSPQFFRLTSVWFETFEHADSYLETVAKLKRRLKRSDSFEFHFADISHEQRVAFYEAAAEHQFGFVVCSFDKGTSRRGLKKEVIYERTIRGLVNALHSYYQAAEGCKTPPAALNERIVYDECHDPHYVARLKYEFRQLGSDRAPGAKLVKKVSPGKSKADPRLQLADMIGGGVGRFLAGDDTYYRLFRQREIGIVREAWQSGGAAGDPAAP